MKPLIVLADFHHTMLFQSFIYLFEKRYGWKLFRPEGKSWYPDFYWHPLPDEAIANLTKHNNVEENKDFERGWGNQEIWSDAEKSSVESYLSQDNHNYRWLPLERASEIDLIVCSTDRNQHRFKKLRDTYCPKARIIRYIGNVSEDVDEATFDIGLMATQHYYDTIIASNCKKPGILYHPEFDLDLYSPKFSSHKFDGVGIPMAILKKNPDISSGVNNFHEVNLPIIRCFLNFIYHHRESNSPWEIWNRYCGYCSEVKGSSFLHGLGTPPPDIEIDLDVIMDTVLKRIGRTDLLDRRNWPDLRFNRGEPSNHGQISELMKLSNLVVHTKRAPEGYGFVIHCLAASGVPPIVEPGNYAHLSARCFLENNVTCIHITGHDVQDKENFRRAVDPDVNFKMSKEIYARFCYHVNFDDEADKFKTFL